MDIIRGIYLSVGAALLSLLMTGCADTASGVTKGVLDKVFEPDPPKVVIRIKTEADVNPDMMGRPSPIVIRVYDLRSDDIFNNADFFPLYEDDAGILGDDMTARDELELPPGESVEIEKELDMEAKFIGIMAAYRDLDNATWRGSIETPPDETTYIDVTLGRLAISVKKGEKKGGFLGF